MTHYSCRLGLLILLPLVQLASGQPLTLTVSNPVRSICSAPPTNKVALPVDQPSFFSSCLSL